MNNMLVAVFDTAPQAFKGVIALKDMQRAGDITLYSTAVISKDASGTIRLQQATARKIIGARLGILSGILVGVWGGTIGLLIGAAIGGLAGLILDLIQNGISTSFLKESAKALPAGKAALLAEVDERLAAPIDVKLVNLGGYVRRWQRSNFVESQFIQEMDCINGELSRP